MLLQFSNVFLYALLGLVILVLPMFFEGATDTIYKIAAAALFCIGPVTAITAVSHLYARAAVGLAMSTGWKTSSTGRHRRRSRG